jgi:PAS domain S-box-containing protein
MLCDIRVESAYKFLHDRIQQAAYSLIAEEHRAEFHLRIGRALLDSMTADDRAAARARIAGIHFPQHVEKRYRRKDGGVIWVDASALAAPIVSGTPLFAGVVVDITDRKRAEEELRRSEASLAQAQQISRTGSWRWNVSTGVIFASVEFRRIFGFDPRAAPSFRATFMERIHPEDWPTFEQIRDRAVRDGSRFQHEYRIVLPDGSLKYLQTVGQPDSTEPDDLEFVGTAMDITERRRAKEALRSTQEEVNHPRRATDDDGRACNLLGA